LYGEVIGWADNEIRRILKNMPGNEKMYKMFLLEESLQ